MLNIIMLMQCYPIRDGEAGEVDESFSMFEVPSPGISYILTASLGMWLIKKNLFFVN